MRLNPQLYTRYRWLYRLQVVAVVLDFFTYTVPVRLSWLLWVVIKREVRYVRFR